MPKQKQKSRIWVDFVGKQRCQTDRHDKILHIMGVSFVILNGREPRACQRSMTARLLFYFILFYFMVHSVTESSSWTWWRFATCQHKATLAEQRENFFVKVERASEQPRTLSSSRPRSPMVSDFRLSLSRGEGDSQGVAAPIYYLRYLIL